ncbi:MAG TPA: DinB family protein [Acidimicrobiales bacterium]|nr:DinB family protein [Acidimicrobiales bacterium]
MSETLLVLFRDKTWATLALIEFCRGLGPGVLDATTPGTYGTIRSTLRHLVDSEQGYLELASGESMGDRLAPGENSLDELAARMERFALAWERLLAQPEAAGREVVSSDGWRMVVAVPMAEAIHHSDDHRGHVMSILGAHGFEPPEPNGLDVWGYAIEAGLMTPVDQA